MKIAGTALQDSLKSHDSFWKLYSDGEKLKCCYGTREILHIGYFIYFMKKVLIISENVISN